MDFAQFQFTLCILLQLVVTVLASNTRRISFNSLCDRHGDVVHVVAEGSKDTIHYVYSSNRLPSVLIARTNTTAKLKLNCSRFHDDRAGVEAGSVRFSRSPDAVMVLVFTQLIEYTDKDNTANLKDYPVPNSTFKYNLSSSYWTNLTFDDVSRTVTFTANNDSDTNLPFLTNGSFSLKFHLFDNEGYGSELPHLGYNENITHVDVTLDHLRSNNSQSRFAVEMVLVANDRLGGDMMLSKRDTLDDEHSPVSFHSVDWLVKSSNQSSNAFLSWKLVCYTSNVRDVPSSERINNYGIQPYVFHSNSVNSSGLAFAFFGLNNKSMNIRAMNVSFGGAKAKFYNATQYTAWTFAVGLGAPIAEGFSLLIILVVAIGLGIPILLIIVGTVYMAFRRRRLNGCDRITSFYAEIN